MGMASSRPSLVTPRESRSPGPDTTQWEAANQQRLAAIELQREKIRDLERRARQREIENAARRLESREERARALELQARQHKPHGPPLSQKEKYAVRSLDDQIRDQEKQRKLDEASIKRIEQRRVTERLELARREETSHDRDATVVAQDWELWRSEDRARRRHLYEQEILRTGNGMRAGIRSESAGSSDLGLVAGRDRGSRTTNPQRLRLAYDGEIPSFLKQEFEYMGEVSSTFPEVITPSIQMSCLKSYQRAIAHASMRLPCGICGGLFQEDCTTSVSLEDENLLNESTKASCVP
ncbi:hypothetical protein BKA61DRAFT_617999 [Leptodontidium sp. MPI-SDFR-AT-0119]|nr:hypothetical protein BKA61DRAFT_617999 [Leptodontidium sp. MPI-SDFR-AT-0119]